MAEQENAHPTERVHRAIMSEADYESGIDDVILTAQQTIHVFDVDLTKGGYSSLKRFETLRDFLLGGRGRRLELVLHETDFLTARCPRLMNLLRTHSHSMLIHKTHEHARIASDPFIVADGAHYVHRFHRDDARSLLALHDHAGARQLEERFGQLMEASHPAVFATTLGL